MNDLTEQVLEAIITAAAAIFAEELICYLIIKRQKKLSDYKEQKAKKHFIRIHFIFIGLKNIFFPLNRLSF
ncbi:MAG: hypothetical protein LUG95_03680 [Clostridiales bacterium]|nr:hypothetical protein [Clostridiales bacterium]